MKRLHPVLYGAALVALSLSMLPVLATPEPSPVPEAWELKLDPSPPLRIRVAGRTYWYMLYTATNNTGGDIDFHPEIVRVNQIESEVPADQAVGRKKEAASITVDPAIVGVQDRVFAAIKKLHAKTHPFLIKPVDAIARLMQGTDNARSSVAVFKDLDPRVSSFTIYFGGLSGEKIVKLNPAYDPRRSTSADDDSNEKYFVLRKTLAIPFTLPGDLRTRRTAQPSLGRMTWVMR